jgi:hypothetical protein
MVTVVTNLTTIDSYLKKNVHRCIERNIVILLLVHISIVIKYEYTHNRVRLDYYSLYAVT